jgi:hypothetical protein
MEKLIKPLKNEQGYFLILATIMLLALLTIISIAATHTASTEVQPLTDYKTIPTPGGCLLLKRAFRQSMMIILRITGRPTHRPLRRRWMPVGKPVSGWATKERLRGIHWVSVDPGCMDLQFTAAPKDRE